MFSFAAAKLQLQVVTHIQSREHDANNLYAIIDPFSDSEHAQIRS